MDATTRERFDTALDRIEAGLAALDLARDRAQRRAALLDRAADDAVAALDTLIAGGGA